MQNNNKYWAKLLIQAGGAITAMGGLVALLCVCTNVPTAQGQDVNPLRAGCYAAAAGALMLVWGTIKAKKK